VQYSTLERYFDRKLSKTYLNYFKSSIIELIYKAN